MAKVKIKELPVIEQVEVTDQHIMVLETKDDTYQITVEDLKILFSCDKKIAAAVLDLQQQIDDIIKKADETNTATTELLNNFKDKLDTFQNNIDSLTKRVKTAESTINKHGEQLLSLREDVNESIIRLNEMDTLHEEQNARVDALEKDNVINKENIENLTDITTEHTEHLENVDKTLEEHKEEIDSNKETTDETIDKNFHYLDDRIDSKYHELLEIIDHYHHLTHDEHGNIVIERDENGVIIFND